MRRLAPPVGRDAGDAEALAQVVEYYHATLLGSPDALGYLRSRRVDDPEAIEVFRLGHANRTLCLPPAHQGAQGGRRAAGTAAAPRGLPGQSATSTSTAAWSSR